MGGAPPPPCLRRDTPEEGSPRPASGGPRQAFLCQVETGPHLQPPSRSLPPVLGPLHLQGSLVTAGPSQQPAEPSTEAGRVTRAQEARCTAISFLLFCSQGENPARAPTPGQPGLRITQNACLRLSGERGGDEPCGRKCIGDRKTSGLATPFGIPRKRKPDLGTNTSLSGLGDCPGDM